MYSAEIYGKQDTFLTKDVSRIAYDAATAHVPLLGKRMADLKRILHGTYRTGGKRVWTWDDRKSIVDEYTNVIADDVRKAYDDGKINAVQAGAVLEACVKSISNVSDYARRKHVPERMTRISDSLESIMAGYLPSQPREKRKALEGDSSRYLIPRFAASDTVENYFAPKRPSLSTIRSQPTKMTYSLDVPLRTSTEIAGQDALEPKPGEPAPAPKLSEPTAPSVAPVIYVGPDAATPVEAPKPAVLSAASQFVLEAVVVPLGSALDARPDGRNELTLPSEITAGPSLEERIEQTDFSTRNPARAPQAPPKMDRPRYDDIHGTSAPAYAPSTPIVPVAGGPKVTLSAAPKQQTPSAAYSHLKSLFARDGKIGSEEQMAVNILDQMHSLGISAVATLHTPEGAAEPVSTVILGDPSVTRQPIRPREEEPTGWFRRAASFILPTGFFTLIGAYRSGHM